jgi:Flp pilus assembly protein TadD
MKILLTLTSVSFILLACAQHPSNAIDNAEITLKFPSIDTTIFKPVEVESFEKIYALSQEQKQHFLEFYHSQEQQNFAGNLRIYHYLEGLIDSFNYTGATLNATSALDRKEGNCLTLSILTKALSDVVGLSYEFQRVNSPPIYTRNNEIMTISAHVRTIIFDPAYIAEPGFIVFRRPHIVIDYFPTSRDIKGRAVSETEFIAMYYQNLAASALSEKNYPLAFSLLQEALTLDRFNAESINSLAVLYMKLGNYELAGTLLKFVIDNEFASANVFSNYILYLRRTGQTQAVAAFLPRIAQVEDDNPYRWLDLGKQASKQADYTIARHYFLKAIKLAPYLSEGYFDLAKNYYLDGDLSNAEKYLIEATNQSQVPDDKKLYGAKLAMLRMQID